MKYVQDLYVFRRRLEIHEVFPCGETSHIRYDFWAAPANPRIGCEQLKPLDDSIDHTVCGFWSYALRPIEEDFFEITLRSRCNVQLHYFRGSARASRLRPFCFTVVASS